VQLHNNVPTLAGSNTNRILDRKNEDLAVADAAGLRVFQNRLDDDLDLQLRA
jgi:hypothetical protein